MQTKSQTINARYLARVCTSLIFLLILILANTSEVFSKGNLTKRALRLEELKIDAETGFSKTEYKLETGSFYKWRITSDGRDEYKMRFPGLSRNAWFDQISIHDKEVKTFGGVYAVEFDDEGTIDIYFVPIRPGSYEYYVENYQKSGMSGILIVR